MDLKKLERVVYAHQHRESHKPTKNLIISGKIATSTRDLRNYARKTGYKDIVIH